LFFLDDPLWWPCAPSLPDCFLGATTANGLTPVALLTPVTKANAPRISATRPGVLIGRTDYWESNAI
jgi:hypothetical protein